MTEKTSDGKTFSSVMQLFSAQVFNACVLRHCEYFNNDQRCLFCAMTGGSKALASWEECLEGCLSNDIVPIFTIWQASAGSKFEGIKNTAPIEYILEVGPSRRAGMKKYDVFTHCIDIWK